MGSSDLYRKKATELRAIAALDTSQSRRLQFQNLARAYLHLAIQADRNSHADLVYATPRAADRGGVGAYAVTKQMPPHGRAAKIPPAP